MEKNGVFFSHTYRNLDIFVWWKGGVETDGLGRRNCMLLDQRHIARTRTGANILYGGRAGWRMMGWVAVIACYGTSATLLAHVPEPIVMHGGRAGWKRTVFFSHTYRSQ